ncbi:MAG TPA: trypsin-like peptidase domain-containing protein [Candidatus Hydrogenedens sp.]|nr:trypsin-like peptidase domain-containing protein [Candidatus Hydrogenedens sp.]HOL20691.1 trypsin-like peptidase domain-containing protein [Candidatus Hydrogenedens sp.]HPP59865.1 trypsin-like peptidase domain-containing protein [Candidatus Hydrogenedens sp.]
MHFSSNPLYFNLKLVLICITVSFLIFNSDMFAVEEPFSDTYQNWLNNAGYPEDEYQIEYQWVERTYRGNVYGFLLRYVPEQHFREIYFDEQGVELSLSDLQELNIQLKDWTPQRVEIPTETRTDKSGKSFDIHKASSVQSDTLPRKSSKTFILPPFIRGVHDSDADATSQKGVLKIGSIIDLDEPISLFNEESNISIDKQEDTLYSIQFINFFAEDALGIRLHIVLSENIPPSHYLYISNTLDSSELNAIEIHNKEMWTPTIFSDEITFYYVMPRSSSYPPVPVIIDSYAYLYKDPIGELAKLGNCYEDVTCYDSWTTISKGIVGLSTVSRPNVIYCTGSLLNDGNPRHLSQLILTAFHCVGDQEDADGLEFYWFYQSQTCNASPPLITTVPKTKGGADFLTGSNTMYGTDMTLLRMRNVPPDNVVELGFTNFPVSINTAVVAIHHPHGSYKRISFGTTIDTGSPNNRGAHLRSLNKFHEVVYNLSSTESGSSGCPLFLEDTQLIIGQLWGGEASCNEIDEPDYYGRMDVSYPLIKPYLYIAPDEYDVDKSGVIDTNDLLFIVDAVLGVNSRVQTDLTRDSKTDACDIQMVFNQINSK